MENTPKNLIDLARNYTSNLRNMLFKYDQLILQLTLDKHPAEKELILYVIDSKLKLAALNVNDDILSLLAQYIERDYLSKPFSHLDMLSTTDDGFQTANFFTKYNIFKIT